jgi:anti-sigma28 factor (negative regulator of flagellin synthesis)
MSSIDRIASNLPIQKLVSAPVQRQVPADAPRQVPVNDKLELSGMSHLLATLKKNDIRAEKVAEVKSQIQAGTYEDDEKLDGAINRLLDDLLK